LLGQTVREIHERLSGAYGPQGWWPGQTPFEVCVGAILTQNTAWSNVEKAIANLKQRGLLSPERLAHVPVDELALLIRPAGYFNQKARKLHAFLLWLTEKGGLGALAEVPTEELRESLLSVKGIGPETADSILLYALGRPVFVIDAYTVRVLRRHGMVGDDASYCEIQEIFADSIGPDPALFNEFHALFVRLGKERCHRRGPACEGCPLEDLPGYPAVNEPG